VQQLLSKGIRGVDLRVRGRVVIETATFEPETDKPKKPLRLSERR